MNKLFVILFSFFALLPTEIQTQSGLTPLQKEKMLLVFLNNYVFPLGDIGKAEWNHNSDMVRLTTSKGQIIGIFYHLSVKNDDNAYIKDIRSGIDRGELYYQRTGKVEGKEVFMIVRLKNNNNVYFEFGSTPKEALKNLDN